VDGQLALPDPKSTEASNLNRSVITAQHHSSVPVKDMLLVIVREAGPEGVSAEQIRARAQIKFGVDVNPNTLTVSLVRHRKDGKVKCDKKRWFYVNPFNFSAFTASLNHSANGSTEKSKSPED
jgi:hypothetical protein